MTPATQSGAKWRKEGLWWRQIPPVRNQWRDVILAVPIWVLTDIAASAQKAERITQDILKQCPAPKTGKIETAIRHATVDGQKLTIRNDWGNYITVEKSP